MSRERVGGRDLQPDSEFGLVPLEGLRLWSVYIKRTSSLIRFLEGFMRPHYSFNCFSSVNE